PPYTTLFRSEGIPPPAARRPGWTAGSSRRRIQSAVRAVLCRTGSYPDLPFFSMQALPTPTEARAGWDSSAPQIGSRLARSGTRPARSEEHTSELQSRFALVCRLLL